MEKQIFNRYVLEHHFIDDGKEIKTTKEFYHDQLSLVVDEVYFFLLSVGFTEDSLREYFKV